MRIVHKRAVFGWFLSLKPGSNTGALWNVNALCQSNVSLSTHYQLTPVARYNFHTLTLADDFHKSVSI